MVRSMEEDSLIGDAVLYLQKQQYPDGCTKNEKRSIRRKALRFTLSNGELLYTKKDKTKVCMVAACIFLANCCLFSTSSSIGFNNKLSCDFHTAIATVAIA